MFRKFLFFSLVVSISCIIAQAKAQEFVTNGLVSFWSFDKDSIEGDIVNDEWGENHGTMTDGQVVAGKINEGIQFNGTTTMITIPDSPSLQITEAMSIEAWINMRQWVANPGRNVIVAKYDTSQPRRYIQFSINPDNGLATYMGHTNGTAYYQTQKGGQDLDWVGKWVHVAFTWDNSDGGLSRLYVDGKEVESYESQQAHEQSLPLNDLPWVIGAMPQSSRFFDGVMDEVRIYNRRLSSGEIMTNFNAKSNVIAAVHPLESLTTTWGEIK